MATLAGTRTVTNTQTGIVFTISGVQRNIHLPDVDGEPFQMEYDIALFEGKPSLFGGFKKPLCKFIIAAGSGMSIHTLMERLERGLSEPDEPDINTATWALVNDDWPFFITEVRDFYHGNKPLTIVYIWPK